MICFKCKNQIPDDSKFCQYCGSDLTTAKFCPYCGAGLQMDMNFCPKCGKRFLDATPNIDSESASVSVAEPAAQSAPVLIPAAPVPASHPEEPKQNVDGRQTVIVEPVIFSAASKALSEKTSGDVRDTEKSNRSKSDSEESSKDEQINECIQEKDVATQKGKMTWLIPIILVALIAVIAGYFLLKPETAEDSGVETEAVDDSVDVSVAADSVLYLEIYDKQNELIGTASGFLLNDTETLVTNYHVVQNAYSIVAKTADGSATTNIDSLRMYDEVADLAILRCADDLGVTPLNMDDSDLVTQGDVVYAVGYPLGLANTLSDGIVSSRYLDEYGNDILQVTAAISEGNSGGPLLNEDGHVIGVMCAYYVYGQNLNIAISSNTLGELLEAKESLTNLKYWTSRPNMPGQDIVEENEGIVEQEPPIQNNEKPKQDSMPKEDTPQNVPEAVPQVTPKEESAPIDTPEAGTNSSKTVEEMLQGMWVLEYMERQPFNKYEFVEFSGNTFYKEQYYDSGTTQFVWISRGTFSVDSNNSICFHATSAENYYGDGRHEIHSSLNENWSPRPITEQSENRYVTSSTLVYNRVYQRPSIADELIEEWCGISR